jgi:hypothetical protein
MVTGKAVEGETGEGIENGGEDASSRNVGMGIKGSKEVFLMGTVEVARKAFEGVSESDLERVVVVGP